jgi:hypothetical protein
MLRPRPMKARRSVSASMSLTPVGSVTKCAAAMSGSLGERLRRSAKMRLRPGEISVSTNIFEKAGCALSLASGANTSSAKEVTSISRSLEPSLMMVTRRASPLPSETTMHSISVLSVPTVLMNVALSSHSSVWQASSGAFFGSEVADHQSLVEVSRRKI